MLKYSTKVLMAAGLLATASSCQQQNNVTETSMPRGLGIDLADLDTSVNPCEDFYGFIVNGWRQNHPIPDTESRWGNFNILVENNYKKLHLILDSLKDEQELSKGDYAQLVGDYYAAAMDSTTVEEAGMAPLQPLLEQLEAVNTHDQFLALMADFKLLGISHPWSAAVGVDDKNSEEYLLSVRQSGLGLPDRDYYLKDDSASAFTQEAYRKHIANMLILSGLSPAEAAKAAPAVYGFEQKLARAQMSRVERRVPENVYHKMAAEELFGRTRGLMLAQYFKALELSFDSVNMAQIDYLEALPQLIRSTPVPDLKHYARWHMIHSKQEFLPHAVVAENFDFFGRSLYGKKGMKPRWRRSLSMVEAGLGEQLGRLYVERHFPESSKAAIEKMVEDLRSAYRDRINGLAWMSDSTKARALEKLAAFNYKIGYPDQWKDYSQLNIDRNDLFANALNLARFSVQENFERLGKKVDKNEWFMPPHIVNAYYSGSYNEIVFPAGILQPPFYSPETDDAINYGAIGGVIGHEFTHGFDDRGRKYNAFGNLKNWWTHKDMNRFSDRTDKMVMQYSDYQPLKETFVNGHLTLGENIADLGGLTLAYYAYKKSHVEGQESTPAAIDGFSWDQRIFLGWGRVWQSNQTDKYLRNQVVTDSHSPARYRVNGPMSNMPEFKTAWGCEHDDAMVRPDSSRVIIW